MTSIEYGFKCLECGEKRTITAVNVEKLPYDDDQVLCCFCGAPMVRDYAEVNFNLGNLPSRRRNRYLD